MERVQTRKRIGSPLLYLIYMTAAALGIGMINLGLGQFAGPETKTRKACFYIAIFFFAFAAFCLIHIIYKVFLKNKLCFNQGTYDLSPANVIEYQNKATQTTEESSSGDFMSFTFPKKTANIDKMWLNRTAGKNKSVIINPKSETVKYVPIPPEPNLPISDLIKQLTRPATSSSVSATSTLAMDSHGKIHRSLSYTSPRHANPNLHVPLHENLAPYPSGDSASVTDSIEWYENTDTDSLDDVNRRRQSIRNIVRARESPNRTAPSTNKAIYQNVYSRNNLNVENLNTGARPKTTNPLALNIVGSVSNSDSLKSRWLLKTSTQESEESFSSSSGAVRTMKSKFESGSSSTNYSNNPVENVGNRSEIVAEGDLSRYEMDFRRVPIVDSSEYETLHQSLYDK